jgi:hypothetical protein
MNVKYFINSSDIANALVHLHGRVIDPLVHSVAANRLLVCRRGSDASALVKYASHRLESDFRFKLRKIKKIVSKCSGVKVNLVRF